MLQAEKYYWHRYLLFHLLRIANETKNGDEYVELSDTYKLEGKNRSFEKGKSGGVGFIISKEVLFEYCFLFLLFTNSPEIQVLLKCYKRTIILFPT